MSDKTQTDEAVVDEEVVNDQQTEVVESDDEEASQRPSTDDDTTDSDSLDFDELLSVPAKSSKEDRKGLSRREHRKLLDEQTQEVQEEVDSEDLTLKELREQRKLLEQLKQEQESIRNRERSERKFKQTLEERGISQKDFSDQYKEEFLSTRDELLEEGMSFDKAVDFALRTITPKLHSSEKSKREKGRKGASLPAQSTSVNGVQVYKASRIYDPSFPQEQFNEIKSLEAQGKVKIIMDI